MVRAIGILSLFILVSCFDAKVVPKAPKVLLEDGASNVVGDNAVPSGNFLSPASALTVSQGTVLPITFSGSDVDNTITFSLYHQTNFNTNCNTGTLIEAGLTEGTHSNYLIDTGPFPLGNNFFCLVLNDGVHQEDVWSPRLDIVATGVYSFLTPNLTNFSYVNNGSMVISWSDTDGPASSLVLDLYISSLNVGACSQGTKITGNILESSLSNTYSWDIANAGLTPGIYYLCLRRSDVENEPQDIWSSPIILTSPIFRPVTVASLESGSVTGAYGNAQQWSESAGVPVNAGSLPSLTDYSIEFLLKFPAEGFSNLNTDYKRVAAVKDVTLFTVGSSVAKFGNSGLSYSATFSNGNATAALSLRGAGINSYNYFLDNSWHHVVLTRNRATNKLKIYVDGKSNTQMEVTAPNGTLNSPVISLGSATGRFMLDEFQIYDEAITPSMVQSHFSEFQSGVPFSNSDSGTPVEPYDVNIVGKVDLRDYASGHPTYNQSVYSQLSSFPRPHFKRAHTLIRNTRNMFPPDIAADSINKIESLVLTDDERALRVQKEMVEFGNYALTLTDAGHTPEATPNLSSTYINLRKDVPLSAYIGYKAYSPPIFGDGSSFICHPELWPSSYVLKDTTLNQSIGYDGLMVGANSVVLNPAIFSPSFLGTAPIHPTSLGMDALQQSKSFDQQLDEAMITRPINMIFENGEWLEGIGASGLTAYLKNADAINHFIESYLDGVTLWFISDTSCTGLPQSFDLTYFNIGAANKDKVNPANYAGTKACQLNALWKLYSNGLFVNLNQTFKGYLSYNYINNRHPWSPTNGSLEPWIGGSTGQSVQLEEASNWDGQNMQYSIYNHYKVAGSSLDGFHYPRMRDLLTTIKGHKYATDMNYMLAPSHWSNANNSPYSWGLPHFFDSRVEEVGWGDHHAAPASAAGWVGQNAGETNILPSQWLSILKFETLMGAEYFLAANFNNDTKPPGPNQTQITAQHYAWQLFAPPLAQAITSHYQDIFDNGYFLKGSEWKVKGTSIPDSGNYKLTILEGNFLTPVYVRRHMTLDRFVIAAGHMRMSNVKDSIPESKTIRVKLEYIGVAGSGPWNETFTLEARRQGSVYLFDRTNSAAPVFYQLDEWHESAHYSYWSDDIKLEAEMYDSLEIGQTAVRATEAAAEYAEYVTYLENLSLNKKVEMHFDNKNFGSNTFYLWAKVRSPGSTLSIDISRMDRTMVPEISVAVDTIGALVPDTNGDFQWVLVGQFDLADRTQILLEVTKTAAGSIDFDKVFVTLDPMLSPQH